MEICFATVAGLLAVISFIPDARFPVSSEALGECESTDDPRQPILCSASSEDQQRIVKCIQANETAKTSLQNYTWIFTDSSDVVVTNICNKTNEVFVGMSDYESESLFNHTLQCEDRLGVTTTTTTPTTSSEEKDLKNNA
uniref:Putative ixodes 14 kDa proteinixodes 14 kDa protein n=1 Tax=Ixodes ricinus TaxID=34613 RepID=A0A147BUY4_IXORI